MENYSNLAIDLVEQSLLCMYYLYAPSWERFMANDNKPDTLKTGKELRDKEMGKRLILTAQKMYSVVKSGALSQYIEYTKSPVCEYFDSADFVFDLSQYFNDQESGASLFTADLVTDVNVTIIRKLFRKIEQRTEVEKAAITVSEDVAHLYKAVRKCIKGLEASGMLMYDSLPLSYEVALGAKGCNKYELCELEEFDPEETYKFDVELDTDTWNKVLIDSNGKYLIIEEDANDQYVLSTREGKGTGKLFLTSAFFDRYIPKREILIQLLAKYFSINVITLEEIEKTLLSCPTLTEFNQWLEERAKSVVVSEDREIEHVEVNDEDEDDFE